MKRQLLAALALLLVWPGILRAEEDQQEAVRGVEKFGGVITRDDKAPGQPVVTNAGLKDLAPLTKLQKLDLRGTLITGAGLKDLAPLTQLRTLLLGGKVTGTGLKDLAALPTTGAA